MKKWKEGRTAARAEEMTDGQKKGRTDGMEGWKEGRTDGMEGWKEGRTDGIIQNNHLNNVCPIFTLFLKIYHS
ncbi:hypothetical protein CEXT_417221 [Caerostris extrusa]|uniref:Uncharacterized protein n=1 Tax=Caerostris extrusa TaxID=172846 RepID=A0AAV4QHE7_CAEEX|nr:hypothetical protein CEXT_417221 [Caerostris extrusa]